MLRECPLTREASQENKIHDSIRFNNNIVTYYEIAKNNFIGIISNYFQVLSSDITLLLQKSWPNRQVLQLLPRAGPAWTRLGRSLDPAWAKLGPGNLVVLPGGPYMPYGAIQCYTGYTCTIYHDLSTCIASLRCFCREADRFIHAVGWKLLQLDRCQVYI